MAMEVITTTDKDARDRMFEDLRKNGNELEKQVVKFSGVEPVLNPDGTHICLAYDNSKKPKQGHFQRRWQFRSTWSVAYPAKPDSHPTPRRARRDATTGPHASFDSLKSNLKEEVLA